MDNKVIYTIGYAHHTQESLLELLIRYDINCVIDVRTIAYSRFHPQFNMELIRQYLKAHGIVYMHMADTFGIMKREASLNNSEGHLDFVKFAQQPFFLKGIERVENGVQKGYCIAIMCAEKDPIDCHRTTLVARKLFELGYDVRHILHDGSFESHSHLEKRMEAQFCPEEHQMNLFGEAQSKEERLEEAYKKCSKKIFIANSKRLQKKEDKK